MTLENIHSKIVTRASWIEYYKNDVLSNFWIEKDQIIPEDNDEYWIPWSNNIIDLLKENLNIEYDIIRDVYITNNIFIRSSDELFKMAHFNILNFFNITKSQRLTNRYEIYLYKRYTNQLRFQYI